MRIKLAIIAVLAVILALLFWPSTQKILFHTESEFGPIWVYEEDNQRRLSFNGVPAHLIQSQIHLDRPEHLVAPYNQMLMSSLFFTSNPKKILMIGLGGATTAKALNLLLPKTPIDIVEINPALPPIAAEYFDFREDARNKIFIEDGVGFMKNAAKNSYDLIILDAFDIDYIPPGFLTDAFMKNVRKALTKDGIIAVNTYKKDEHYDIESALFKRNFGKYYRIAAGGNSVIIASNGHLPNLPELHHNSNFWRYRFTQINTSQLAVLALFKDALK